MRAKQLEGELARLTGYPAREIDERMRPLREHGMVPHGPRGRHAPDIQPHHAAAMLLSLVSRRAVDAWSVASRLARLEAVPRPNPFTLGTLPPELNDTKRDPWIGRTLYHVLQMYLADPEHWTLARIEAAEDGSLAWVYTVGRIPHLFSNDPEVRRRAEESVYAYERQRDCLAERRFVFGRGFLREIGVALKMSSCDWSERANAEGS